VHRAFQAASGVPQVWCRVQPIRSQNDYLRL
jgi:hypothetical protein